MKSESGNTAPKILITATELHLLQFWTEHIKAFIEEGYSVDLVCSEVGGKLDDLKSRLYECGNPRLNVVCLRRNPFSPKNLKGLRQLKKLFAENKYDAVFTNEPVMGMMTRIAAASARKACGTKVIYIVHGFHFWKGAPLLNWALFYPAEKFASCFTDVIVTINNEDYEFAKLHFKKPKVLRSNGIGVNLEGYAFDANIRRKKRESLGLKNSDFAVFCVSELTERKNLFFALGIIKKLVNESQNVVKFFVRGKGPLHDKLQKYIDDNSLAENVFLMGYGDDIHEMDCAADAFLLTSLQEGLPVAVLEAMSCGLPCVVSDIRGSSDLFAFESEGITCSLADSHLFVQALSDIMNKKNEFSRSEAFRKNMGALEAYSMQSVHAFLKEVVESELAEK